MTRDYCEVLRGRFHTPSRSEDMIRSVPLPRLDKAPLGRRESEAVPTPFFLMRADSMAQLGINSAQNHTCLDLSDQLREEKMGKMI